MTFHRYKSIISVFMAVALLSACNVSSAQSEVIDLKFNEPSSSEADISRTLQSIVKVQGEGGTCQDALYLITHYGDRTDLFEKENQKAIDNPWRNDTWRYCSVFETKTDSDVLMGRNWDNQNVGSIIVSLYHPPDGYSSISISRAIDLGFPLNISLDDIAQSDLGERLLLAPFYSVDGINERGVAVAVAGVRETKHELRPYDKPILMTYLIRKMLDQAASVDEAVRLAGDYMPFDLDENSLNSHLMVTDSTGKSVILEYGDDSWMISYPDKSWQILTTKPIYGFSDDDMKEKCWRFNGISESLVRTSGKVDWADAMNILRKVEQVGTTWSVVYSLQNKEMYLTVYKNWDRVYHLNAF